MQQNGNVSAALRRKIVFYPQRYQPKVWIGDYFLYSHSVAFECQEMTLIATRNRHFFYLVSHYSEGGGLTGEGMRGAKGGGNS